MTNLTLTPIVPPPLGGQAQGGVDVEADAIWTAKGDLAVGTGVASAAALPVGTNGQVLTVDSGATDGVLWATPVPNNADVSADAIWTAKGDLVVGTGATAAVALPVGANGYVLMADSATTDGVKWAAPVTSASDVEIIGLDKTGAVDIMPSIQAAYDANLGGSIALDGSGAPSYYANSAVLLDNTGGRQNATVIDGKGATLVLGTGLPTISSFTADTSVKGLFFPNTLRSALSGGVVTATAGNQAISSGPFQKPWLILRNFIFDCRGLSTSHSAIIAYGNKTGIMMEHCRFLGQRAAISWVDYADRHTMRDCSSLSPLAIGSWGIYAQDNGDDVEGWGNHNSGCSLRAYKTRGFNWQGGIATNHIVSQSYGKFTGIHSENDQTGSQAAAFTIDSSHVVIEAGQGNPPHSGAAWNGWLVLNDTVGLAYSEVLVADVEFRYEVRGDTDPQFKPLVYLQAMNDDSCFRWRRNVCRHALSDATPANVIVGSGVAGITTALNGAYGLLCQDWEVWKRRGTWVVTPLGRGPVHSRTKARPTLTSAVTTAQVTGTLTTSTLYHYMVALQDELGNYSQQAASTASTAAAAAQSILVTGATTDGASSLIVWRSHGAVDVLTAPEYWVRLPWQSQTISLYDSGANINGVPWTAWTGGDPVPNTDAATDHTVCKLKLDDGTTTP